MEKDQTSAVNADNWGTKRQKELIRIKAMDNVPTFNGKYEEYEKVWSRLFAVLGEESGVPNMLRWAEKQDKDLTMDDVGEYGRLNGLLAQKLSKVCTGE